MDSESIYAMHGPMGKFFKTLKWHCEVSISSQRIREVREIPVLNDELVIRALRIFNGLRSVFSLLYDWKWLQRPSCGRSNAKDEVVENGQFGQSVPYVWNPAHEARVGFLSREDSSHGTRWFPVEPCFAFLRSMLTTMVTVFASTCAATQAVTMFR